MVQFVPNIIDWIGKELERDLKAVSEAGENDPRYRWLKEQAFPHGSTVVERDDG